MKTENRLILSLFALRVTVGLVMLVWNLDKFINPQHAAKVYESFYLLGGLALYLLRDEDVLFTVGKKTI